MQKRTLSLVLAATMVLTSFEGVFAASLDDAKKPSVAGQRKAAQTSQIYRVLTNHSPDWSKRRKNSPILSNLRTRTNVILLRMRCRR